MFKRKKKKTVVQTPELRKPTPPPPISNFGWQPKSSNTTPPSPPTSGSNAVKPNQNYILPNSIKVITDTCPLLTPCGWCTKWDKKCDEKIGWEKPQRGLRAKANMYDDAIDFSYGKCLDCKYDAWCDKECNPENNFKYFQSKENNNETI